MTRLDTWLDEEVAALRDHAALTEEEAANYREALTKTLHAAQLDLADKADAFGRSFGDAVLSSLKEHSDRARNHGLREWFRRYW